MLYFKVYEGKGVPKWQVQSKSENGQFNIVHDKNA